MMINFIFFGTLILYVVVSFYVARYIKDAKDYYVMGNKASTLWVAGSLTASYTSAVTFVGIAGIEYLNGPPIFLLCYGSWIGMVVAMLYVGRKLRALGSMTMPDFIQSRYGSTARVIATIIMIIGLMGYGLVQFMGAGVLLSSILGISYESVVIFFAIALILFCAAAGMWSVMVTDTIMLITILLGCFVIAPLVFIKAGGFDGITYGLMEKSELFWSAGGALYKMPTGWTIGQLVLWALFFPVAPWLAMRAFPAKSDFVLMRSIAWSTFFATAGVVVLFLGVSSVYLINPEIKPPDRVFVWASQNLVNPLLGGIGIAGIMAAIMSTSSSIFIAAGFALSRDLLERSYKGSFSDKQKILIARIAMLVIGVIILIVTLTNPLAIYWIGAWAGALFATSWMPMVLGGFESKRVTRQGAIASMIIGMASYIALYQTVRTMKLFSLPLNVDPVIVSIIISCIVLWVVSIMTKANADDSANYDQMKISNFSREAISFYTYDEIKKEIQITKATAWSLIILSLVFFGYLAIRIVPAVS
jgi:sodium/pantothenate symporter